jgi:hypothetical protein
MTPRSKLSLTFAKPTEILIVDQGPMRHGSSFGEASSSVLQGSFNSIKTNI